MGPPVMQWFKRGAASLPHLVQIQADSFLGRLFRLLWGPWLSLLAADRYPCLAARFCRHASAAAARALTEFDCSLRSLRIALRSPPTSSSLGDEKHVPSLLLSTAARDPGSNARSARAGTMSP